MQDRRLPDTNICSHRGRSSYASCATTDDHGPATTATTTISEAAATPATTSFSFLVTNAQASQSNTFPRTLHAQHPAARDADRGEQSSDRARFEPGLLSRAHRLPPLSRHLFCLSPSGKPVDREDLPTVPPVLERVASVLERGRRKHPLNEHQVWVSLSVH